MTVLDDQRRPRAWAGRMREVRRSHALQACAAVLALSMLAACKSGDDEASTICGSETPPETMRGLDAGAAGARMSPFQPSPGTTWQWQLAGLPLDLSVDAEVFDVDLFTTSNAELAQLRASGQRIICYFSAGTWEPCRPDSDQLSGNVRGEPLEPPFGDELWLDIRAPEVRRLIQMRLDMAVARGCDAVEPDNVDAYDNVNGFGLTPADQLAFNRFIAAEAHSRGLSVGLKNDLGQLATLVNDFDWALNEECVRYDECASYQETFIAAGKAVFHAEYESESHLAQVCAVTRPLGLSTILKRIDLDAWRRTCP